MFPASSSGTSLTGRRSELDKLRAFPLTAEIEADTPQGSLHRPVCPRQDARATTFHIVQKDAPVEGLGGAASELDAQRVRHGALGPEAYRVPSVEEVEGPAPILRSVFSDP